MRNVNPALGVALIVVCIVAQWVFAHYHVDPGNVLTTAIAIAVAIIFGRAHESAISTLQTTKDELVTLRASMRPRREPSMHDIDIPPGDLPPS